MSQKITLPGAGDQDPLPTQNLLIAFVLMGVAIFGMQYFMPPPAEAPKSEPKKAEAKATTPAGKPAMSAAATAEGPASSQAIAASKAEEAVIETDLYKVRFTNQGAVATSWQLKMYKDSRGRVLELVGDKAAKFGLPFAVQQKKTGQAFDPDMNSALFQMTKDADGLGLSFEYRNGDNRAKKRFRFQKDRYLVSVRSELVLAGRATEHNLAWRGGFGDQHAYNAFAMGQTVKLNADSSSPDLKTAKDGWHTEYGNFAFAGMQDKYFSVVAVNKKGLPLELQTAPDTFVPPSATDGKEQPNIGMGVGGAPVNELDFFVGPKDVDRLRTADAGLERLVDFGKYFGFIAKPLFLSLNWVNDRYLHNYGWTIVVVTLIINVLMLPLKLSSMKSMQKTQMIQPEIQRINEKYKGIAMTDPRAAKKNEEMMELYKKHGVNPAGGCLPLLLQMPFLIGFYSVLDVAIEMRQASWLWVTDLSQPETIAIRVLPIAMVATQILLQKLTPTAGADPQQQRIMLMTSLLFAVMFYGASSGLVLYWLTGNLFAMVQQYVLLKLTPVPVTPAAKTVVNVKKKR
ncbi:MAG: membrane protein insertase YidC [Bryobacter sp.]